MSTTTAAEATFGRAAGVDTLIERQTPANQRRGADARGRTADEVEQTASTAVIHTGDRTAYAAPVAADRTGLTEAGMAASAAVGAALSGGILGARAAGADGGTPLPSAQAAAAGFAPAGGDGPAGGGDPATTGSLPQTGTAASAGGAAGAAGASGPAGSGTLFGGQAAATGAAPQSGTTGAASSTNQAGTAGTGTTTMPGMTTTGTSSDGTGGTSGGTGAGGGTGTAGEPGGPTAGGPGTGSGTGNGTGAGTGGGTGSGSGTGGGADPGTGGPGSGGSGTGGPGTGGPGTGGPGTGGPGTGGPGTGPNDPGTSPHTPVLSVSAALGGEDSHIALTITARIDQPAVGETLAVTVGGVPVGAVLSAGHDNGDGSWTLNPADLPGLTLTPPADYSGSLALTVTGTSTLGNASATATAPLPVSVTPVADAPTLTVTAATGSEDSPVALAIGAALHVPAPGETLSVTVSGVPAGATLSAGHDNGDGSWTLTATDLAGLTLTPPADFSGSLALTVAATSGVGGTTATTGASLSVAIAPVADAPTLSVAAATGLEDRPIALAIGAALNQPAPGETLTVTVSGLPAGAVLSAGHDNGDGSWTLTAGQIAGLTLTPPADFSGNLALTVAATSSVGGTSATTSTSLTVSVAPEADAPLVNVSTATGLEDQPIALAIGASLVAPAPGEILAVTVSGVPAGATLSAGHDNGDGSWTLAAADLTGLTLTPPADFSGSLALTVTATSSVGGTVASTSAALPVSVAPVADAPSLTVSAATGREDHPIALAITAALDHPAAGEVLSVTVSGLPAGAVLSAGHDNGDGSWTLTAAQLSGLTLTPPSDFSGNIALTVTATGSVGGTSATTSVPLGVAVSPEADAPLLTVTAAAGLEDTPIALAIGAALVAPAPGETLSVTIAGVPAGAALSAGHDNGNGTWTLAAADLQGLKLTPPADFSGNIGLSVTATSSVAGTVASSSAGLTVAVGPVADAPLLTVSAAIGLEDTPIALSIGAALNQPILGEILSVTISGLPAGASLSAGHANGDGSWTLTAAQLTGLTLTPPSDYFGSLPLTVTATSGIAGLGVSTSLPLAVSVTPVADAPTLSVSAASGLEDSPIALAIGAALHLPAPGETLSVTVSGVPAGAVLSAGHDNGDGSWTLAAADLTGLTLTPPADFSGSIALGVTATSGIGGTLATTTAGLTVAVAPVADAPALAVTAAAGIEDHPIALSIGAALTAPAIGETLSITVSGVPAGATLSAGVDNGDGSWTLTPAQLTGLTLTPPADFFGSLALTVTATGTLGGDTAATSATLAVTVAPEADAPSLVVAPALGLEDQPIALAIGASLLAPAPGEVLSVTVSGVPAGASLSAGHDNGDGSWTLTAAQIQGLTITPPTDFSGSIALTVTATSSLAGVEASTSTGLTVNVAPVADAPSLAVTPALGLEDQPVALTVGAALTAPAPGETLSITVSGVPAGAVLSAGHDNGDGSWSLTQADLAGLSLIPPEDFYGTIALTVQATSTVGGQSASTSAALSVNVAPVADAPLIATVRALGQEDSAVPLTIIASPGGPGETIALTISGVPAGATLSAGHDNGDGSWTLTPGDLAGLRLSPPANFHGDLALTVTATGTAANGDTASASAALPITIGAVADGPTLAVTPALGREGTPVALDIAAALTDPGEILSVTVSGLPAGAVLSAGIHNPDGTWTLAQGDLAGLTLTGPDNLKGGFDLAITATSREANGSTASVSAPLHVNLDPVADAPSLAVLPAAGIEDHAVPLAIAALLGDPTETLRVTVSGLPAGAVLSAGHDNGDGSWTLAPADLAGLTLTPPANFSGALSLGVAATSREGNGDTATVTTTLGVTVAAAADAPSLTLTPATGQEGSPVALTFAAALTDPSETLSITVSGVPAGATLSAGTHNPDGTWTLTPAEAVGLQLTPPVGFSGRIELGIAATSTAGNGDTATTSGTLPLLVESVAATPLLAVAPASGLEDQPIALAIAASLPADSHHDTLVVTITGVPDGAVLSAGTYAGNGAWTLSAADLDGLTLTPPHDYAGTLTLNVAVASIDGTARSVVTAPLAVTVAPDHAVAPILTATAVAGREDTPIALHLGLGLADASDQFGAITITGMPAGASLSAGVHNPDGSWTLTADQITGLTLTPPANSNVGFTLGVSATTLSGDGTSAQTSISVPVSLVGVADAATATAANVTGTAGSQVALTIGGALTDTDGSESLTFVVSGVPDGFALTAGSNNGDNTWTLTPGELANLKLVTPPSFNGQLTLYVNGVSHENDGDTRAGAATAFTVGIGDVANGYLIDLGLGVNVGGIGVGAHVGALPPIDLFPAGGGLIGTAGVSMNEDVAFRFNDAPDLLNLPALNGLLGLVARIEFSGLPPGATLSAGTNVGNGTWWVNATQLAGLTLTPPPNSDGDFNIVTTARLISLVGVALTNTPVHVLGVADAPTLNVSSTGALEGAPIPLAISAALTDTDGSERLSYAVSGLPAGFSLSAGIDNGNGTWTLHAADLAGLKVVPAQNFSGTLNLTVSAVSTEREGDQAVTQANVALTITPVANGAVITADAHGSEGAAVPLNLQIALRDGDGSESLTSVTISGLPAGATLLGATANGDGTWSVDPAHLGDVRVVPAAHFGGDFTLTVTATSQDGANGPQAVTTATLPVHVDPVATAPTLAVAAVSGAADSHIPLAINAGLVDTDGSEALTIVVSGLPHGAVLSAGALGADGSWTLTPNELAGLTLDAPNGTGGHYTLQVTAVSHEVGTGLEATTVASLPLTLTNTSVLGGTVTLAGSLDAHVTAPALPVTSLTAPDLHVGAAVGFENTPIALNLTAGLLDHLATETLSVTIAGLPSGASLSAGTHNPDGTWTLDADHLAGLTLTPPLGSTDDFSLTVTATAHDSLSHLDASATATLPVTVLEPVGVPSLVVAPVIGLSTGPVSLSIAAGLTDHNPGDVLSVNIAGVPSDISLSAGTHNLDGSWTLTPGQLTGLTLNPGHGTHDPFTLNVTANVHEVATGQDAHASANLAVTLIEPDPASAAHLDPASFMAALDQLPLPNLHEPISVSASVTDLAADHGLALASTSLSAQDASLLALVDLNHHAH